MFNICEKTPIYHIDRLGVSRGHIQQCLSDRTKQSNIKYTYCGAKVQKGTVDLHTCKGIITLKFDVKDGWARSVEIVIL